MENNRGQEKRIRKKKIPVLRIVVIIMASIVVLLSGTLIAMRMVGKHRLQTPVAGSDSIELSLDTPEWEQVSDEPQAESDDSILYKGKRYQRNEDIISILIMGIDKESVQTIGGQSWNEAETGDNVGGQADAQILMLIDPHTKTVNLVTINRNTMTDVDVWDQNGDYLGVFTKQIALQHGYGDGGIESCEHQVKAVSRLFHGIPIHSYAAIEMDAIPEMNHAVGGVTVEVLDDVTGQVDHVRLYQGDTVTLNDMEAYYYLRYRNVNEFGSSDMRLKRQKQYVSAFAKQAKEQALSNINVAVDLYKTLQKYMVTDMDEATFTYMVTEYIGYDLQLDTIYSLEGETIQGDRFEEFYVDDDALQDLIVELFYEPV